MKRADVESRLAAVRSQVEAKVAEVNQVIGAQRMLEQLLAEMSDDESAESDGQQ
jgi:hypothetical protein